MKARPLDISDAVKAKVRKQVEWSEQQGNWWHPEIDKESPGDNPAFVMMLEVGFRCVYTHTVLHGKHLRTLSVSVENGNGKYPHEIAFFTIASMFGFMGGTVQHGMTVKPDPTWSMNMDTNAKAIIVCQEIK